jgi:hypothetical protein
MGGYDIPLPDPASGSQAKMQHQCHPDEASGSATPAKPAYNHQQKQRHVHRHREADDSTSLRKNPAAIMNQIGFLDLLHRPAQSAVLAARFALAGPTILFYILAHWLARKDLRRILL